MRCIQGAVSFSPTGKIASSRKKIALRMMDSSWCPRSLSIKLSGNENVRWITCDPINLE